MLGFKRQKHLGFEATLSACESLKPRGMTSFAQLGGLPGDCQVQFSSRTESLDQAAWQALAGDVLSKPESLKALEAIIDG